MGCCKNAGAMEKERALGLYQRIFDRFYLPEDKLFLEHYPPKEGDQPYSWLWPLSGLISAATAVMEMVDEDKKGSARFNELLTSLNRYYDQTSVPKGYDSYVRDCGGGRKFYDDNAWLGLDFIKVYQLTKDGSALEKAKEIFDFVISGWSEEMGGGVYWAQEDFSSKNTCSNGPAADLALYFYQATGEQAYLDWTLKIYEWTYEHLLDPEEGVFWDNLREDGSVDKRTYTYNAGTLIHANALLYEVTGDQKYLDAGEKLAAASLKHFAPDQGEGSRLFPSTPWFNAVLLKGYLALYKQNKDATCVKVMKENIDYAWDYARDESGFFSPDWSGKTKMEEERWLLDQAAMVELYALIAAWEQEN